MDTYSGYDCITNYGGVIMDYKIRRDNTSKTEKHYCVLQNPSVDYHDTKVIFGGSPEIVKRKIDKQLKKWGVKDAL